jgi:hypothetical protein
MLRGRDPDLGRSVWIHEHGGETGPRADPRRREDRRGRLRWLACIDAGPLTYDVYEDPGGVGLTALRESAGGVPWPAARRQIAALAEALAEVESEGGSVRLGQLWIDRAWNVRLLDSTIGPQAGDPLAPANALASCARELLGDGMPADLPEHAEPAVRRLLGQDPPFASVREAREAFGAWDGKPAAVGRSMRATQTLLAGALPALGGLMALILGFVTAFMLSEVGTGLALTKKIELAEQAGGESAVPEGELRAAYLTLISASFGGTWGRLMVQQLEGRQVELYREAIERHPSPSPEEIARAEQRLEQAGVDVPRFFEKTWMIAAASGTLILALVGAIWLVVALVLSAALRGGLSFRMMGIRIRTLGGPLASRGRCVLRTLVAGTPALVAIFAGILGMALDAYAICWIFAAAALLFALGGAIHAAAGKGPSLQDRVVRTRLVPR